VSTHIEIISQRAAARRSGISASLIRSLEANGHYPSRVQITEGKIGYVAEEVERWLLKRIAVRNAGSTKND
jgi:predicted DNA-binding transcriptional regulator AlpA